MGFNILHFSVKVRWEIELIIEQMEKVVEDKLFGSGLTFNGLSK